MIKTNIEKMERKLSGEKDVPSYNKNQWWNLPIGDSRLIVLPPISEDADVSYTYYIHFLEIKNSFDGLFKKRVFVCLGKDCPICAESKKLIASNNPSDKEKGSDIKAKKVVLYNVLNGGLEHKVLTAKQSQQAEIEAEIVNTYKNSKVDITSFDSLMFINIQRYKTDPYCRARVVEKIISLTEDQKQNILESMVDLSKVYIENTPEELLRALKGEDVNSKKFMKKEDEPEFTLKTADPKDLMEPSKDMSLEDMKKILNG